MINESQQRAANSEHTRAGRRNGHLLSWLGSSIQRELLPSISGSWDGPCACCQPRAARGGGTGTALSCQHRQRPSAPLPRASLECKSQQASSEGWRSAGEPALRPGFAAFRAQQLQSSSSPAHVPVEPPGSPQELEPPPEPGPGWARGAWEAPSALPGPCKPSLKDVAPQGLEFGLLQLQFPGSGTCWPWQAPLCQ